jgi:hypothetical protein
LIWRVRIDIPEKFQSFASIDIAKSLKKPTHRPKFVKDNTSKEEVTRERPQGPCSPWNFSAHLSQGKNSNPPLRQGREPSRGRGLHLQQGRITNFQHFCGLTFISPGDL